MADERLVAAADAGIHRNEQLMIAFKTMVANGGIAQMQQIYDAVDEKMQEQGFQLSQQGKHTLRAYINRDAVQAGYVLKADPGWEITKAGRRFLDEVIEDDEDTREADTYGTGSIYPYDMPEEVDVREEAHSIFAWMRKLRGKQLIVDPEFQRNLVWKPEQKSLFIESVLLNIPLPPLYVNQNKEGNYIIVDGLQRTITLSQFFNDEFELNDLKVLTDLNDLKFSGLDPALRTRFEDKKLWIYVIRPSVPLPMVYDIFHRINTGGTQLTRQEIRNCFYIGNATRLLKELAEKDYFKQAIDRGISPKRMKDREAILRFLAFRILDYETHYKNDMDAFLGSAMKTINLMTDSQIDERRHEFERVMRLTFDFFGRGNFRLPTASTRGGINIALLESVGYFFAVKSDSFFQENRERILRNFEKLLNHEGFVDAIRISTGDTRRVLTRFRLAQEILGDMECSQD